MKSGTSMVVMVTADSAKRSLLEAARAVAGGARTRRRARLELGGPAGAPIGGRRPDELIGPALAQNARTWEALERLGVEPGTELPLAFCFQSGGTAGDHCLAGFLERELRLHVVVEQEGVSGRTPPLALRPETLDVWVEAMIRAGFEHGACRFAGWTVTVERRSRAARDCPELDSSSDRKPADRAPVEA